LLVKLDPDRTPAELLRHPAGGAAAEERIEHRILTEAEQLDQPAWQLFWERGRVAVALRRLAVELPDPERPLHELVARHVRFLAPAQALALPLREHQNRFG